MQNRKVSFKIKVLMPIITIFIVSIIIISAINYVLFDSTIKSKTNEVLELFTNSIISQEKHLDIVLDAATQTLNNKNIAIAKSIAYILEKTSADKTVEEYQRIAALLDIIELDVADRNGIIINGNFEDYRGFDYNSTEPTSVYMNLADGTISELSEKPRKDEISGNITHYSGVSRMDDSGFIQLGFDANILGKIEETMRIQLVIEETKIGDNGYAVVLTDGLISAHPDSDMLGSDMSQEEWFKAINDGDGFEWVNIDNTRYYAGYKNIDQRTVLGLVPRSDYYEELNRVLTYTVLLLALAITIMIGVVYIVLDRLLMPIKNVTLSLGEIAKGNLDARITGDYNDEFALIKDAVNSMVVGINSYMNDKLQAEHAAYESELAKSRAEAAREAILDSIAYASKIQKNLLPYDSVFKSAFSDHSVIWKPRDIVGGDIYWIKNFAEGSVLCVCDCTGHGTPGALLTMVVASTFEMTINDSNYKDTAQIVWELEKRLVTILNVETNVYKAEHAKRKLITDIHDGCDLAVLFISKDGTVTMSSGNTHVFVCDGKTVTQHKGQKIRVGDGELNGSENIKVVTIPANPDNKFYIASDGLYDQPGYITNRPFGYGTFKKIILENHNESQTVISDKIWQAFEEYRGENARVDDFELITFKV